MLLTLIVATSVLAQHKNPVVGKWEAWMEVGGRLTRFADAGYGSKWEYSFGADGRFKEVMVNHIMENVVGNALGTYTVTANNVVTNGIFKGSFDDGYRKETRSDPEKRTFTIDRGMLQLSTGASGKLYMVRVGTKPPDDLLNPKAKPSDAKAGALLHKVEAKYLSIRIYRDRGTMVSSGRAFEAKNATFTTTFDRARKTFRYDLGSLAGGKVYQKDSAWSDGKKSWLYMSEVGPSPAERPLGNALSILSVSGGETAELVPSLLMPKEVGRLEQRFDRLVMSGGETVNGKPCVKITLSNIAGMSVTLWVDSKSYLIRRVYDGFVQSDIHYDILENK